jgi:hypothetical protein
MQARANPGKNPRERVGEGVGRETRPTAIGTIALVRLRMSVHRRVEVPLWRCFPPRVESNCIAVTRCGEQLETKGQSVELTGQNGPRHKLDTALCD